MNVASYYHDLPGKQGDPLEASTAYGMDIYANWLLLIYCMLMARESDIVNGTVLITKRSIDKFRCADCRIDIMRYDRFERLSNRKRDSKNDISMHGPVSYDALTPRLAGEMLQGTPNNLVIKTCRHVYQQEYRIIGARPVKW